jgi:transposase, IS5 family
MVRRAYAQRSVFEVLLPDGDKLWDAELRAMDEILDDDDVVDLIDAALRRRYPLSGRRGRFGTPATVVLRMLLLKHLRDWSFDECEREVRGSLVYRAFCRIDCERAPDAKTLIRLAHLIGPETLQPMLERMVGIARQRRVTRGRRLRVDTTVVETNIHYPTDSSLLADGVRVLTRLMKRLAPRVGSATTGIRDRTRSVTRRVFELVQRSRAAGRGSAATQAARTARVTTLYRELMTITRAVVHQADVLGRCVGGRRPRIVTQLGGKLQATASVVRRVLAQARARVLKGDTHHPDKVLSIFEPHTEVIRKGKAAKPTEFGNVVKLQEADGHIITDYQVCAPRVRDECLWGPALERHRALFGRPPRLAVADAGFASTANERLAARLGVQRVALPRRGRPPSTAPPRPRWYRRALRWRTGSEGRISAAKRCHGLRRCRYRGPQGMERWVGLGVLASNLRILARAGLARGSGRR